MAFEPEIEHLPEVTTQGDPRDDDSSLKNRLCIETGSDTPALDDSSTREHQPEVLSPSSSSSESSSSPSSQQQQQQLPRRPNSRNDRLTTIARTAVLATKEQFWDSNESQIHVAQTAVDRWEELYMLLRKAIVASSRSIESCYETSKAGVQSLDQGILVPVRDYVLLPTFGVAEHVVSETSSFLKSERIRKLATEDAANFVSRAVPFGLGNTVVIPAVRLGADTFRTAWGIARYPVPSPNTVRETVDFWLNGSKHNLSVCGREIVWYVRRADANIARTLRRTRWTVLGSGPYETLDATGKQDVMDHLCDRYFAIGRNSIERVHGDDGDEKEDLATAVMVAKYEFMANVRAYNRSLYRDLVETGLLKTRGGNLTENDEWLSQTPRYRSESNSDLYLLPSENKNKSAHALWFRLPFENGQRPKKDVPWVAFDKREADLLEQKFQTILSNDMNSNAGQTPERTVLHDEEPPPTDVDSAWEAPKYPTNSSWCNIDLDHDIFLDQKRHAVRFVRCCPACRKRHHEDEGSASFPGPLIKVCCECRGDGQEAAVSPSWNAEKLLALPPPIVGLYRPTMWRTYGPDEIRRAVWFLDMPQNGPQPYGEDAQALLEDAYHFLKWTIETKQDRGSSSDENLLLTVQVPSPDNGEQQLVQFSSLTVATAIGRGLGGAISLFKRKVYRGAYNLPSQENKVKTKGASNNNKSVEENSPLPIDEESRWTTTTEDALSKLSLTIGTPEPLEEKDTEELDIDINYNECFEDTETKVEFDNTPEDLVDPGGLASSGEAETSVCHKDDLSPLAYLIESPHHSTPDNEIDTNTSEVDHLVLVVHGIGEMMKAFDLFGLKKVPTIVDCCGYLRENHTEISDARLAQLPETNTLGRVEYLPVEWHEAFSIKSTRRRPNPAEESVPPSANQHRRVGISDISLRTIPNMRSFANDTLMDILYFMSPVHHDIIVDIVTFELNFIVNRFRTLTGFNGEISIIGHSLGSIIAWDILDHQQTGTSVSHRAPTLTTDDDSYRYPQLNFRTDSVFLLGSPIPVFLMMRNEEKPLDPAFTLNGCDKVFNIFHPYDPVSYRIEPLIHPRNAEIEPDIMTHWNGGFRFQYQTKRLWKKLVDQTLRAEETVIHRIESGIEALGLVDSTFTKGVREEDDSDPSSHALLTGCLNGGRRIDYMLQEKEIDRANEYVAALAAHSCYWLEKDLSLFIANEICLGKKQNEKDVKQV